MKKQDFLSAKSHVSPPDGPARTRLECLPTRQSTPWRAGFSCIRPGLAAKCLFGAALLLSLSSRAVSHADLLTDPSQLSGGNSLIDFESLSEGVVGNPLALDGAVFSGPGTLDVFNSISYAPPPVVYRHVLRSINGGYADVRIDFATPVSEIGFGMWDPNLSGNFLRVYDSGDNLLESAEFPTGDPGGSYASFRGIRRSANEIAYAILDVAASNEFYGIDHVSFGATAIPEPGGLVIGLAAATVWLTSRRSRR